MKNRTILTFIMSIAMVFCLACGLLACDKDCAHEWKDGEIIRAATCSTVGALEQVCDLCGETQVIEIPKTAHGYSTEWSSDADKHWHAASCEHVSFKSNEAAHTFGEVVVEYPVSDAQIGLASYTCTVCGYKKSVDITEDHTEHLYVWNSDRNEHWKAIGCCSAEGEEIQRGEHTFNKDHVCTVCGEYSLVDELKSKLISAQTSTVVISDLVVNVDGSQTVIEELAINFAFEEDFTPVARMKMRYKVGELVADNEDEEPVYRYMTQVYDILYKGEYLYYYDSILDNISEKFDSSIYSVSEKEVSYRKTTMEALVNSIIVKMPDETKQVVDMVVDYVDSAIEYLYTASEELKTAFDNFGALCDKLPKKLETTVALKLFFTETKEEDGTFYTFNFKSLSDLNDAWSKMTLGNVLKANFGDDYATDIPALVDAMLDKTVGDFIDALDEEGIDIEEINDSINTVLGISSVVLGESPVTLEKLAALAGLTLPEGMDLAAYVKSDAISAYKVMDFVHMLTGDNTLTKDDVVERVDSELKARDKSLVYDIVVDLITDMTIEAQGEKDIETIKSLNEELKAYCAENEITKPTPEDAAAFLLAKNNGDPDNASTYKYEKNSNYYRVFWYDGQFVLISKIGKIEVVVPSDLTIPEDGELYIVTASNEAKPYLYFGELVPADEYTGKTLHGIVDATISFFNEWLTITTTYDEKWSRESLNIEFAITDYMLIADGEIEDETSTEEVDSYVQNVKTFFEQIKGYLSMVSGKIAVYSDYKFDLSNAELIKKVEDGIETVKLSDEKLVELFEEKYEYAKNLEVKIETDKDGEKFLVISYDHFMRETFDYLNDDNGAIVDVKRHVVGKANLKDIPYGLITVMDACSEVALYRYSIMFNYTDDYSFTSVTDDTTPDGEGDPLSDEEVALILEEMELNYTYTDIDYIEITVNDGEIKYGYKAEFNPNSNDETTETESSDEIHTWELTETKTIGGWEVEVYTCNACGETHELWISLK